jgi:hypothetical protein
MKHPRPLRKKTDEDLTKFHSWWRERLAFAKLRDDEQGVVLINKAMKQIEKEQEQRQIDMMLKERSI